MKINNKINIKIGIFVGIFLLLVSPVFAFGVGMPYMENKEAYVFPGQVTDLKFTLQVEEGTEGSVNIKAEIIEGSEIIEMTDSSNIYAVAFGQHTPVNFRMTIPNSAQIGDSYHVKLGFSAEAGPGSFAFGSVIEQNFDVIVGEKPAPVVSEETEEEEGNLTLLWVLIIAIIIIAIIIIGVAAKKKK